VTPAHDPNDFEIGERHGLDQINIFEPDGRINANGGKFAGQHRFEAREAVVAELEAQGLLEKHEIHAHAVGHCYRCHTVIEPYLSEQWFVDMKPLAGPAIETVRQGQVAFSPPRWSRLYFEWMENIRDWCISRQIWWGHQIPAWYCESCNETVVAAETPSVCPNCGGGRLRQDPDVLDTWFSSALWPFATLGWPEQTEDLDYFYPTSVLSTARDILYLWVARMIMSGLKFAGDIPFHTVIIHPTVLNAEGRRMSKSLGTGVDPLELIGRYGTDATRFGLMVQATTMQDMRFTEEKLAMSRNFANKIWNASRFALMHLDDYEAPAAGGGGEKLSAPDRWILSRTQKLVAEVSASLDSYDFGDAARRLYEFFWSEFCDWYLELVKGRLYGDDGDREDRKAAQSVLVEVLDTSLRLLHPFMPFITEEIWQKLPVSGESIMIADWPAAQPALVDDEAEREIGVLRGVVTSIRTIRAELKIAPTVKMAASAGAKSQSELSPIAAAKPLIERLAGLTELKFGLDLKRPPGSAIGVVDGLDIYVPLEGLVDIGKETERLNRELAALETEVAKLGAKLGNEAFLAKAPVEVVQKQKDRLDAIGQRRDKLRAQLLALAE
jgi:valyl-tRNA synthetase